MFAWMRLQAALAFLFLTLSVAQGAVELAFDFNGTDPARNLPWVSTAVRAPGWSTSGWVRGLGLGLVTARDGRLAFSVSAGQVPNTLQESVSTSQYLAVGIQAPTLNGYRVRFTIRRESWFAPLQYAVRSSMDGFASNLFVSQLLENADAATDSFTFLLPQSGFGGLTAPVEFRLIPFAARYSGHAASLTAFSLEPAGVQRSVLLTSGPGGQAFLEPARTLFEEGELVRFRALPDPGYKFGGWSGSVTGRGNPRALPVTGEMSVQAVFHRRAAARMELGGNLDGVTYYGQAWVFKDCFKLARTWLTRGVNSFEWDSGQTPPLDSDGWPVQVPFTPAGGTPQYVHTLMPAYGAGAYTVRFRGTGRVDVLPPGGGRVILNGTGGLFQQTVNLVPTAADWAIHVQIQTSSASDPIRQLEILAPGQAAGDVQADPFHPAFLDKLGPFRILRFMDWLRTNGNPLQTWAQRTKLSDYTQTQGQGVAHEWIIRLCNQTGKHPWICIPHMADDEYVRQTARLYRDTLAPGLRVYVEYSNETWNGHPDFTQTQYVSQRGQALGLHTQPFSAGQRYTALRSAQIFGIFSGEYGASQRHRHVNVLASQAAALESVTVPRVEALNDPAINPQGHTADVIAIAPYFGVNFLPVPGTEGNAQPTVNPMPTVDELVTTHSLNTIQDAVGWVTAHRRLADEQGWRLVCYEGGQHFTGIGGAQNNDELTARLFAANRDPRMGQRYQEYFAQLQRSGVDLFMNFGHIQAWSKYGAWGALQSQEQPVSESPKWQAITGLGAGLQALREEGRLVRNGIQGWAFGFNLRPDRSYRVESSANLSEWSVLPGMEQLRGEDIHMEIPVPEPQENRRFWRARPNE